MKVLITGGAGFIGSSVCDYLLKLGHYVLIIDNYQTGKKENNIPHPNLSIIEGTIADGSLIKKTFTEFLPDIVLHAAASYKDPNNWEEDMATNISGTINVIKASKATKVRRVIYLQTSLCYGLHPKENPISLDHPLFSGGSSYAISKTTGELYLELIKQEFISFRLANVYGPRNLSGPLPTFFHRLSHNLACTVVNTRRDFVFIDDVVNVIAKAISGVGSPGYYHVATGKDHAIKEVFDLAIKYAGIEIKSEVIEKEIENDDVTTILLDPSKTQLDFDWNAAIELEEGVKRSIAWYKKNSPSQTYTHLKNIN